MLLNYMKIAILLLTISTFSVIGSQIQPNCGQICPRSFPTLLRPEPGTTYVYNLETKTEIEVKDKQSVGIKARVEITPNNDCENVLKLSDVEITGIPDPSELQQQLESNPTVFGSFEGKNLGLCPADDEEEWVVNVKKAILSALQITTRSFTETTTVNEIDLSGNCSTVYKPLPSEDTTVTILERSKSLNKCEFRRKNRSGFSSHSLSLLTEFLRQKLPIVLSNQNCKQKIQNKKVIAVDCTEEQTVSFQESPIVSSELKLTLIDETKDPKITSIPNTGTPQLLLMISKSENKEEAEESDVLSLLRTLCSQVDDVISPEVTESYHSLVTALKTLPEEATKRIDEATKSGEICSTRKLRDLFLGASAFASSDSSIQTIVKAYNNKEFTEPLASTLFTIIAFKAKPSEPTINALLPLLQSKDTSRTIVLGISMVIKNYCYRSKKCEESPAIEQAIDALLKRLQNSDCNLEKITSIKALDNIRARTSEKLRNGLLGAVTNTSLDSGVRVAAIQALDSPKSSNDNIKQTLIEILQKDTEDVDVRIAAYKGVVIPGVTAEQLETIRSEDDIKIKNYIRTHIKNLKRFNRILPENAPEFEEPTSTSLGITRNIQFSYRGATIEADIIHPKGSLVPQMFTLNVWYPIHGRESKLMEINIRHIGLDIHLKKIISRGFSGPEMTLKLAEELVELIEHMKNPEPMHSSSLQISVQIAGKNVLFLDAFEDIHSLLSIVIQRIKEVANLETVDRSSGLILLDTLVEVPTLNGYPMVLHLNDTVVTTLTANYDKETLESSKTRKIRFKRNTMAELSAGLVVKVGKYRPGFEYHMRLAITPSINAIIETKDSRILKARIDVQKEKKILYKFQQNTRLIDPNGQFIESNEVSDVGQESNDKNIECETRLGISFCMVQTTYENSPFPNIEIYSQPKDQSMDGIEVILEVPPKDAKEMKVWSLVLNATNAEENREMSAKLQVLTPSEGKKEALIKLRSPSITASAKASLVDDKEGRNSNVEIEFKCPKHIEIHLKSNVNKTYDSRSVDLTIDYKLIHGQHSKSESIKYTEKSQLNWKRNKKTKLINVSFNGELKTTQFPRHNCRIGYYVDLRPFKNSKSELKVEYNQDFKDKIRVFHESEMDVTEMRPYKMTSENKVIVEAKHLDINYNFDIQANFSFVKSKPKTFSVRLVGKDLEGREDRDVKGSVEYMRTEAPLHQTIKAELKSPDRELMYESHIQQLKDQQFEGVMKYQLEKGKVVTIKHKESITNPMKDFRFESEAEVSYSDKPDKYSYSNLIGWVSSDTFKYESSVLHNGQKFHNKMLSVSKSGPLEAYVDYEEKSAKIKVDNIWYPKSAELDINNKQKSYKITAKRIPAQSITLRVDSTLNSRLKELELHISRVNKSSLKLVTNSGIDVKAFIDVLSKNKRGRIQIESTHGYSHIGDIKYLSNERTILWESNTNKSGKPYITLESQFSCNNRSFLIIKKIKNPDSISKLEAFIDKGTFGLVLESSKYTVVIEGENKEKKFGKLGFFDKINNYEHTSKYNIENEVITIESIGNIDQKQFTKLEGSLGLRQISNISLVGPNIVAELIVNPLDQKKTLNFKLISTKYDQKTNIEWIPKNELKVESLSQCKVEPLKTYKIDALLKRHSDSTLTISMPSLDLNVRKVKLPKPKYIFNTTLLGNNEIQEFDINKNLDPVTDLVIIISKYLKSYSVED